MGAVSAAASILSIFQSSTFVLVNFLVDRLVANIRNMSDSDVWFGFDGPECSIAWSNDCLVACLESSLCGGVFSFLSSFRTHTDG